MSYSYLATTLCSLLTFISRRLLLFPLEEMLVNVRHQLCSNIDHLILSPLKCTNLKFTATCCLNEAEFYHYSVYIAVDVN